MNGSRDWKADVDLCNLAVGMIDQLHFWGIVFQRISHCPLPPRLELCDTHKHLLGGKDKQNEDGGELILSHYFVHYV